MTLDKLPKFYGAPVHLILDDEPALALLFLQSEGVHLISLCFLKSSRRCPLVERLLTTDEIAALKPIGRNELKLAIRLKSHEAKRLQKSTK